ncbi:MAG: hypothetical protein NT027_09785 [Proteobacteria bacterium]|nr:hypothetical protein [Pseudomonadota bacterium]
MFFNFLKASTVLATLCLSSFSIISYAADEKGLKDQLNSSQMKTRFSLIGIISETGRNQKGIAVVLDKSTGKSLTVKVGEELIPQSQVMLKMVQRNRAVLSLNNQAWVVTHEETARNDDATKTTDTSTSSDKISKVTRLDDDLNEQADAKYYLESDEPGLFERWYTNLKLKSALSRSERQAPNGEVYLPAVDTRFDENFAGDENELLNQTDVDDSTEASKTRRSLPKRVDR